MIKVSVIIPCFNGEEYIKNTLKMVFDDSLKEKEVIVVNDGSVDNSLKILMEEKKKYKNLVVINQRNSGQGVARNKALAKAKGEYIFFLDIDDAIAKNAINTMYNYAIENNSDYVYCDYYKHFINRDELVINHHNDDVKKDVILANFAPWGKIISKKLIDDINFKFCEGIIYEDIAVIPFLGVNSKNPKYLNKGLYFYNMTNTSTLRKKSYDKKYEDIIYVSDYLYNTFKESKLLNKYNEELKYIFLDSILKSGVLKFSEFKEGLKYINILRANVKSKFSNLLDNYYYKKEPLYRKFTAFISVYLPPRVIYWMKKIK